MTLKRFTPVLFKPRTQKGAALIEYAILASLVAVAAISAVLLLGESNRTAICLADSTLAEKTLGKTVEPCVTRFEPPPPPPTPVPVPVQQPIVVSSEMIGFLNPDGPIIAVVARTQTNAPIQGNVNEQSLMDDLCETLGFEAPAQAFTYTNPVDSNAIFLPGGHIVYTDVPPDGPAWREDNAAMPFTLIDTTTPIVASLTCTETVFE